MGAHDLWGHLSPRDTCHRSPHRSGLEGLALFAYSLLMDDSPIAAPADWLEALAESDADLAAGRIVPGEVVLRDLQDSLARLEAKAAARKARKDSRSR